MKLIHRDSNEYKPELFTPIKNKWVKPLGGLWTSPVDSSYGWKDWCESNDFSNGDNNLSFTVELKSNAKILVIDDLRTLKLLSISYPFGHRILGEFGEYLNFERIAKEYDAIHLTDRGQSETHLSTPVKLYGWDCESVLILNPEVIIVNQTVQS